MTMPMNSSFQQGSPETRAFDLVVLGGGPAGTCGAGTAAVFGRRVALVEKEPEIGGAGINSGTVPSKTLRETALALSGWRSRKLHGVDLSLRREATVADFTRTSSRSARASAAASRCGWMLSRSSGFTAPRASSTRTRCAWCGTTAWSCA
jgi:pyruvate/2-oxoglutarate dehydrogenase complex dihydrolipoamide dehydrogenase (E3) component